MTNREKAIQYMRRLDLSKIVEKNFSKGRLMQSCGGMGILVFADERQHAMAKWLEEEYAEDSSVVWHIIVDTLQLGEHQMKVETYLITCDSVPDSLMVYDGKFDTYAYVENLTVPEFSEYGETLIMERAGGLACIP